MTSDPEGFLARWSRRKRGDALPEEDQVPAEAASAPGMPVAAPDPIPQPAPPLEDLPSIESLVSESDFSAFLRPGIPSGLRHAALRRMWSLDIGIRDFTGPADYAWDYNAVDGVPGGTTSLLTNNLRSMVAQAVGRTEAQLDAEAAVPSDPEAPETPESSAVVAEAGPPPLRASASWGVERREAAARLPENPAPPPLEIPAFIPPEVAAQAYPSLRAPAVILVPPAPEPATPNPRRRHGGAMPA